MYSESKRIWQRTTSARAGMNVAAAVKALQAEKNPSSPSAKTRCAGWLKEKEFSELGRRQTHGPARSPARRRA